MIWQLLVCSDSIATNISIDAINYNRMTATNLGVWYVQVPHQFVISPMGEVTEPKVHNGSRFVLINRNRVPISKLPHLNYQEAIKFKEIFC